MIGSEGSDAGRAKEGPHDYWVNVHDAKTHLSKLLARVEAGERIVIARAGKPVALLSRVDVDTHQRIPGNYSGLVTIMPDFDLPLPEFKEYVG